ncbi:MAG: GNAT family N-acetyltransferase [Actinomycetota bacterium]
MAVHATLVTDGTQVEGLRDEWDQLALAQPAPPLLRPGFCLSWWRHLGRGRPLVVVARDGGGRLVGLAPLHERAVGPVRLVRWMGHGYGTLGELLLADRSGAAEAIWRRLAGDDRVLDLRQVRLDGAGITELRRSAAWESQLTVSDAAPYIDLTRVGDVDELLATRRSLRKHFARLDRIVERDGRDLSIEIAEQVDADELTRSIAATYDAAERHHPRLPLLATEATAAFLRDCITAMGAAEGLVVIVLRLEGEVAGFSLYLRTDATLSGWLTRYHPAAAAVSPGQLMHRAAAAWAIDHHIDTIDLQIGDDAYKRRWSNGHLDAVDVLATAPGRLAIGRSASRSVELAHHSKTALRQLASAVTRIGGRRSTPPMEPSDPPPGKAGRPSSSPPER